MFSKIKKNQLKLCISSYMKNKSEFEITCAYGGERDKRKFCGKSYKSKLYRTQGTGFNAQLAI